MPKTHPSYPAEFRQQIIELVRADRTPAELSKEFQVKSVKMSQRKVTKNRRHPEKYGLPVIGFR